MRANSLLIASCLLSLSISCLESWRPKYSLQSVFSNKSPQAAILGKVVDSEGRPEHAVVLI
jgi:hypothetical protein